MVKKATRQINAPKRKKSKTGAPRETLQNKRFYTKRNESNLTAEKQGFSFKTSQVRSTCKNIELLIDSGCTSHMMKEAELFRDLDVSKTGKVEGANGTESNIEGRGSISFFAKDNQGQDQILELEESLYVPQYTKNLVSIKKLNEQNASVHFDTKPRIVLDDRSFPLRSEKKMFYLQVDCLLEQSNAATASLQLWHERRGHNNKPDVRKLAKSVGNMKLVDEGNEPCDVCNRKSQAVTDKPSSSV